MHVYFQSVKTFSYLAHEVTHFTSYTVRGLMLNFVTLLTFTLYSCYVMFADQ